MQTHWHIIRRMLVMAIGIGALGWTPPAIARDKDDISSCLDVFGDIWGEERKPGIGQEIDGDLIDSPAAFRDRLRSRDAAVRIVKGGDFSGWDFSDSSFGDALAGTCFHGSKMAGSNFEGVKAAGTGFIKSDLTGTNFAGARMRGVLFRNANLTNVNARNANFSNGHFDGGWFEGGVAGWNLDGADMSAFAFECGITVPDGCPVFQGGDPISARETNFSGASLHSFNFFNAVMDGAMLDETIIGPGQIPDFAKAHIAGNVILRGGDHDQKFTPAEIQKLLRENGKTQLMADGPSFSCNRARSRIEKEICGEYNSDLRQQDRDVALLYKRVSKQNTRVRKSQRAWLKQRNRCTKQEFLRDCLRQSYDDRIGILLGLLGEGHWLKPNDEAVFVDDVLPLPESFYGTNIHKKLVPVLAGASMANVYIMRRADGTIETRGESIGANAHICTLGATGIRFQKETGWYGVTGEKDGQTISLPVFRYLDGRVKIYRNGRPEFGDETDALIDYVSCGMRASFSEMIRIDLPEILMERYRQGPEIY